MRESTMAKWYHIRGGEGRGGGWLVLGLVFVGDDDRKIGYIYNVGDYGGGNLNEGRVGRIFNKKISETGGGGDVLTTASST